MYAGAHEQNGLYYDSTKKRAEIGLFWPLLLRDNKVYQFNPKTP